MPAPYNFAMNQSSTLGTDHRYLFPAGPQRQAGLLVDTSRCGPQSSLRLLEPDSYRDAAERIQGRGGRGAAWFVSGPFGRGVLRHYRRGGWLSRFDTGWYVWSGEENARCVREYRLLRALRAQGLPVPAPIAAGWWRHGPLYRQALLIERIEGARTLAQLMAEQPQRAPWEGVGQTIARFHRAGVWHADLNAHNILRDAQGSLWLIDFDKSRLGHITREECEQNLLRLRRSLLKLQPEHGEAGWQRLYAAWLIAMGSTRPSLSR